MKPSLVVLLLALLSAACVHRHAPPLPAGEWAYRYANGAMAYYDGREWSYGVEQCSQSRPAPHAKFAASPAPATWQWVAPLTGASYGLMATGAGIVYNAHCTVQTISASETLYVFFIDTSSASQPSNGTSAIQGGVSGGMTTDGNDVTWSDQTYPALAFTNGIMLAASTTPDTYTAPNAADKLRCDIKIRSSNP